MTYDYQAKGAADFTASLRDDKLYLGAEPHCQRYRAGWQMARIAAERAADGIQPKPAQKEATIPLCPSSHPPAEQLPPKNEAAGAREAIPKARKTKPQPPSAQLDLF